ncbi:hypothetical protein [Paenibacillus sp. USHLN196]
MSTIQEKNLMNANRKIDSVIDDLWAKAEDNLKKLEMEFNNKKERGGKD